MKKVKYLVAFIILLIVGVYITNYYTNIFINFYPKAPVNVMVKTEGKKIYVKNSDSEVFKAFEVKGVEMTSGIAGHYSTDYAVEKDTWLKWFKELQEMGANTIRIPTIFDDTFYNAFYEFNTQNEEKLYLFQGIQVSDYANNSKEDAFNNDFYATLKEDSISVVDIVHGRKIIASNSLKGSGNYRKDISPWVLGYIIGNSWNPGTMAYTNNNEDYNNTYSGTYFKTISDSTVFEAMLAKIMDEMVSYESLKYKKQRLISFYNDPQSDPFKYEVQYAKQLNKYNELDAERIQPTDKLESGYIATYRLYEFSPGFANYFTELQKLEVSKELRELDQNLYYEGYTQLLSSYHSMPVVILGYGFSSARGTESIEGPITEEEQGAALATTYKDIISSGCSGAIISTWQDSWDRRTWNTSYAVDVKQIFSWRDVQTDGQGYGLLSFDPGKSKSVSHVDGNLLEWDKKDVVLDNDSGTLSVKYDESYIYFLVKKDGLNENSNIYIPIDTTPKTGSKISREPLLTFERDADFILNISGRDNSKLLVHERYESLRANYLMLTKGDDPYVYYPIKNTKKFVPIHMIVKNTNLISEDMTENEIKLLKLFNTYETGKLVYGNSNPNSINYNSLSDFYYGDNFVEVRIPWQLLNFLNPAKTIIHDDYYENYGVEGISINKIYLGLSEIDQNSIIEMEAFKLNGWGRNVNYNERLKKSYYILKESWRE